MKSEQAQERRADVQADSTRRISPDQLGVPGAVPGTVSWDEHDESWRAYAQRYGSAQSAERIHERCGFSYGELTQLLGHAPTTWRPR